MKQVLFICSANYYRSRLAEYLFNWMAEDVGLGWSADSRGLLVDYWGDLGPISPHTVDALNYRGIRANGTHRRPRQLEETDLANSDLIVAVKEAEHRTLMAEQFPEWEDRVEYWHVDDLDCAGPDEAIPVLEELVQSLVHRLVREPSA
jgi:protein-tyrosine phosphatase